MVLQIRQIHPQQSDGSSWFEEGWNIQCVREVEVSRQRSFLSLDSGCDITLVPKNLIKSFRSIEVKPTTQQIWTANNTPISVEKEVELPFFLDEECLWTTALISEDIEEVMLGIDWLQRYECIWISRLETYASMDIRQLL